MYKVFASFWSKPVPSRAPSSHEASLDEESWVFVSTADPSSMTNSWIASPPLIKADDSPPSDTHHFNPIENLLIEHASMSVYEQIASKASRQRYREKTSTDEKLDEQTEDDDEDNHSHTHDVESLQPYSNLTSIHQRLINQTSTINLESSTCSLLAHHRHLHRLHQRRKRSKLLSTAAAAATMNESKASFSKNLDRARFRSSKSSARSNNSSSN